jgi:alkylhydroperoxidase/carboxymuconolactone decarboxylase family protein YurZ
VGAGPSDRIIAAREREEASESGTGADVLVSPGTSEQWQDYEKNDTQKGKGNPPVGFDPPQTQRMKSVPEKDEATASRNRQSEGPSTGPWDRSALATFRAWDPAWIDQCLKMSEDPWISGVLPRKDVELISIAVNAACTNLSAEGTRRHVRGALEAGATREEILMALKIASLLAIHTCSLGAPILLEEAKTAGMKPAAKDATTPVCDKMKAAGHWNPAWDAFFDIAPAWTEAIIAASLPVYASGVLSPKLAELLSIAVDASITHMYAPGTRRHIRTALQLGATMEEIMEVLKICVAQGIQACNLGVPILAEELHRAQPKAQEGKQRG